MRFFLFATIASLSACGSRSVTVVMNAENNSGQKGVALVREERDKTRITIDVAAGPDTRQQQVHIHPGTCGEIGSIYSHLSSLTLQPDGGMHSETLVNVRFDVLVDNPHALNAHFPDDFSLYTSCGNIPKEPR